MTRSYDAQIVSPLEIVERGLALYASGGLPRGSSTGWRTVDEYWTVLPGQWTVLTGIPGCGKSEWLDALAVNLIETGDWEVAYYSPENYPVETHLVKLIEKRVRKPFGLGPTERMSKAEYVAAATWVNEHVYWLDPTLRGPLELIETAHTFSRPNEKKLLVVLDPWNVLEHSRGLMSETDYISFVLTEVVKFCRARNAHVVLVAHPTKLQRNKDGTRPVPGPYDISGSAAWYAKADNCLCVHRDQADPMSQVVELHVQKVRAKHVGKVGVVELRYDRVTGRYDEPSHLRVVA